MIQSSREPLLSQRQKHAFFCMFRKKSTKTGNGRIEEIMEN
jgi:hypothetical protein